MEIKLSSNPDYHPIMQADPCISSNTMLARGASDLAKSWNHTFFAGSAAEAPIKSSKVIITPKLLKDSTLQEFR